MDAVTELAEFADEHISTLDDLLVAVHQLAAQRVPEASDEQHTAAAEAAVRILGEWFDAQTVEAEAEASEESDDETEPSPLERLIGALDEILPGKGTEALTHYLFAYVKARFRPTRRSILLASLLTNAVGNFEVLISAVVREFLRLKPEAIRSDDAKYSLAEIEGYETLEEFRAYCAERYAEALLRGGFEDWMAWFGKSLKFGLPEVTTEPVDLREVFQRRHLLVHNGGVVNRLYLNKMSDMRDLPPLGERLTVDAEYLALSVDRLIVAGTLVQVSAMRKLLAVGADGEHPADSVASSAVYDYLEQGRWSLCAQLAAATHEDCFDDYTRYRIRVNGWLARKRMGGVDAIRAEVEPWQVSALSPKFRLAKLILLGAIPEAYELGRALLESDEISSDDWWSWPLLEEVRAHEASIEDEAATQVTEEDAANDRGLPDDGPPPGLPGGP